MSKINDGDDVDQASDILQTRSEKILIT